jgi:prepilin-type N-terminal cleavage/methylation domain-containing protein/prepilin-type processing-associated H-X9-DG protein
MYIQAFPKKNINSEYPTFKLALKAFTLVELLVVISIIALLLSILMPSLNRARESGQRAVCLSNLKQLGFGWMMYAEDNKGKIVSGSTGPIAKIGDRYQWTNPNLGTWVAFPPLPINEANWKVAIEIGLLYPYCKNYKLYKCPTGKKDEWVTYSIVSAMNGDDTTPLTGGKILKNILETRCAGERAVFIDEGRFTAASYTVYANAERWWDPPPLRHNNGVCFTFADGHSGYWRWTDKRTITLAKEQELNYNQDNKPVHRNSEDLQKLQKAVWGVAPGSRFK